MEFGKVVVAQNDIANAGRMPHGVDCVGGFHSVVGWTCFVHFELVFGRQRCFWKGDAAEQYDSLI
jgi:hypothetical protein